MRVDVTTGFDEAEGMLLRAALDAEGSVQAVTTTSITITFDRYLDPRTAIRQSFCFQSDLAEVASAEDCLEGISTTPFYDPVSRTLTLYLDKALSAETSYKLTVFAARDGIDFGFRSFDATPLEAPVAVTFSTLATDPLGTDTLESPADRYPAIVTCVDAANTYFKNCTGCHGSQGPGGLDLSAPGLASRAAINRVARQASLANQGDEAATKPGRFGAGIPVIQLNNPGNSYLLYKVLARARYYGDTMADGELERLQSWIVGSPMPAHAKQLEFIEEDIIEVGSTVTQGTLQAISNWIAAGAECEIPGAPTGDE